MKQEYKELLLKDLTCRIPYGVIVNVSGISNVKLTSVSWYGEVGVDDGSTYLYPISEIKPYLFPLSSISEDQKYDFYCRFINNDCNFENFKKFYLYNGMWRRKLLTLTSLYDIEAIIEWFHENHIDYRDLIPMGLALDASELNIY